MTRWEGWMSLPAIVISSAVRSTALMWKVVHEEQRIGELLPSYPEEMWSTFRLVPFVW